MCRCFFLRPVTPSHISRVDKNRCQEAPHEASGENPGSFGFRPKVDATKMSQWILFGKWIGVYIINHLIIIYSHFQQRLKHTLIYRCELQYVIAGGVGVYAPSAPPAPSLGNACMMTDRCLLQVGVCDPVAQWASTCKCSVQRVVTLRYLLAVLDEK